jgi:hypothetical protein
MEVLDSTKVLQYLNGTYPRLDYHCDEHFKLFDLLRLEIDDGELEARLQIKDVKAYGPFPPMELHHAIMLNNLLVLTYGNYTGGFVSALIRELHSRCNRPVFVDEEISVRVKFEKMHRHSLTTTTLFNSDAFVLHMDLLCFIRPGMLAEFVMRGRKTHVPPSSMESRR